MKYKSGGPKSDSSTGSWCCAVTKRRLVPAQSRVTPCKAPSGAAANCCAFGQGKLVAVQIGDTSGYSLHCAHGMSGQYLVLLMVMGRHQSGSCRCALAFGKAEGVRDQRLFFSPPRLTMPRKCSVRRTGSSRQSKYNIFVLCEPPLACRL